jgi:hypothetical protein
MKSLRCQNRSCQLSGKAGAGSVIRCGVYITTSGKRHRFRCRTCAVGRSARTLLRHTIDSNIVGRPLIKSQVSALRV